MIHVFILVLVIGGEEIENNESLHFYDLDRCLYFARRLNSQNRSPSTSSPVSAYCKPVAIDPDDNIRVY